MGVHFSGTKLIWFYRPGGSNIVFLIQNTRPVSEKKEERGAGQVIKRGRGPVSFLLPDREKGGGGERRNLVPFWLKLKMINFVMPDNKVDGDAGRMHQ